VEAQAKQANEHDKQQDDVGREAGETVEIGNMRIGHNTSSLSRYRFNSDLGMDESRKSNTIQVDHSPARWLVGWRVNMVLNFHPGRREEGAYFEFGI
jgi:hypothetical protein